MSDEQFHEYELRHTAAPFLVFCLVALPAVLIYPYAIYGAVRMKKLEGRGMAIFSALLLMLPCSPVFVVGIPVGIWAIAVLIKPNIKEAFRS